MEIHLKIIGSLFVLLALVHIIFPKYFHWKQQLSSLSLVNKQIMYVHTFFIAFIVLLMGVLCLTSTHELTETSFGQKIALGLGVFWFVRLLIQLFGYSSKLWKGKAFEFTVHIVFTCFWIYTSTVFLGIYYGI